LDEIVAYPFKTPSDAGHLICDVYDRTYSLIQCYVDDCSRIVALRYAQGVGMIDTVCQTIALRYRTIVHQYESLITSLCQDIASLDPRRYFAQ